ncbi:MAG: acyltransferase family protein [Clostridia bacterium]|nr:acyltransferase family protein [Clostridia bacterium]
MKTRENNYDLLRILSMLGVILIHISATYLNNAAKVFAAGVASNNYTLVLSIFNCIGRFGVPCFLMLSGVFLLNNEKNKDFKYFYKNAFNKILLPTFIFTIFYVLYQLPGCFIGEDKAILPLIKKVITGEPFYHMWYMYMLVGVYLLVPFIIRIKDEIGEKDFKRLAIIFLPVAVVCLWTTKFKLNWNIGRSFLYSSYLMIGYVIANASKEKKKAKLWLFLILGIIVELIMAYLVNGFTRKGVLSSDLEYPVQGNSSPLSMFAGVFFFIAFANLNVKHDFSKLSGLTFYIYLFHAGVWDFMQKILRIFKGNEFVLNLDSRIAIPCFTVIVLILSIVFSVIYKWLVSSKAIISFKEKTNKVIFKEIV